MKKVLLLFISVVSVLHAYAQNADSLQVQPEAIAIDSLTLRLNKLQHDYDFMYCNYELNKLMLDLTDLSHTIDISSNGIVINVYNGEYKHALYTAYIDKYDSLCALFNSLKDKIEAVRFAVLAKMMTSDFSEKEQNVLYASLSVIQTSVATVEHALNYYDVAVQAYKSKR